MNNSGEDDDEDDDDDDEDDEDDNDENKETEEAQNHSKKKEDEKNYTNFDSSTNAHFNLSQSENSDPLLNSLSSSLNNKGLVSLFFSYSLTMNN